MKKLFSKKSASLFLALLIIISLSVTAYAENIDVKKNREANRKFEVENMFPGDVETNDYTVNVSHKNPINLYFTIKLHPGSEKLAEVMKVKVYLPEKDTMIYDGLMKDIPSEVVHNLAADEKQVLYKITAYLDTSVGNEYMYQNLMADFCWWYEIEPESSGGDSGTGGTGSTGAPVPDTSDSTNIMMWSAMAGASLVIIIILLKKKKDEEQADG